MPKNATPPATPAPFNPFEKGAIVRGDIVLVDLEQVRGDEKNNGVGARGRPCVVVQNDKGNEYSRLTIVVPLTDADNYTEQMKSIQVYISQAELGANSKKDSCAECGHIRTISKERIASKLGHLSDELMKEIGEKLKNSLGLNLARAPRVRPAQ